MITVWDDVKHTVALHLGMLAGAIAAAYLRHRRNQPEAEL